MLASLWFTALVGFVAVLFVASVLFFAGVMWLLLTDPEPSDSDGSTR